MCGRTTGPVVTPNLPDRNAPQLSLLHRLLHLYVHNLHGSWPVAAPRYSQHMRCCDCRHQGHIWFSFFLSFRIRCPDDSDTISLILVVFFFIFCNVTALLVNFLEMTLQDHVSSTGRENFCSFQLQNMIIYLVDLSNLLVVINCTANFFVYLVSSSHILRDET